MLLDITHEEADIHTHANLEHQLLELQEQAPSEPIDHEEIDVMSGIDED
jgi:hypothetical protein